MPEQLQFFLRTYSMLYGELTLWVLCGDNGRHFNHSDAPNTRSLGVAFGDDVAVMDMHAASLHRCRCVARECAGPRPHHFSQLGPLLSVSAPSKPLRTRSRAPIIVQCSKGPGRSPRVPREEH